MKSKLLGLSLIVTLIFIVLSSWVLVHLLAIFGIFLAVAYPLWWLFAPKQTACLLCRAEKEGTTCPFCRKTIVKSEGISPKSLTSAVLNGVLILIFSMISIGVVYGESQLLFKLGFPTTSKTASFIIPSQGQYRLGEIFPMKIEIDNIKNSVNAVQADIGFEPRRVEVVSISTTDSFASIFIQKEINNDGGYARLTGGLPNPGWYGTHGLFGTVYFKAKEPGLVTISFLPSSMVLANDSRGTNILKSLPSVSYLILPEKVTPAKETAQEKLITQSNMLIAHTPGDQMNFYDDGSVLGASTQQEITQGKQFNLITYILNGLEEIDSFILTFLGTVISL